MRGRRGVVASGACKVVDLAEASVDLQYLRNEIGALRRVSRGCACRCLPRLLEASIDRVQGYAFIVTEQFGDEQPKDELQN